jgi:hypothetical protein
MGTESTEQRIRKNKRRIFDAESYVRFNAAQVLVGRSAIEENRALALESFTAEASGNRALLASTMDDVFRNRLMLIDMLTPNGPDQERFKSSMLNRTRVESSELQSVVNGKALEVNLKMAEVNKLLVEINILVTRYNEEIFESIEDLASTNAQWLDGELEKQMQAATAAENDDRVTENTARVTEVRERAEKNRERIRDLYNEAHDNRHMLEKDFEDVNALRDEIVGLREKIAANQHRVADKIADL